MLSVQRVLCRKDNGRLSSRCVDRQHKINRSRLSRRKSARADGGETGRVSGAIGRDVADYVRGAIVIENEVAVVVAATVDTFGCITRGVVGRNVGDVIGWTTGGYVGGATGRATGGSVEGDYNGGSRGAIVGSADDAVKRSVVAVFFRNIEAVIMGK